MASHLSCYPCWRRDTAENTPLVSHFQDQAPLSGVWGVDNALKNFQLTLLPLPPTPQTLPQGVPTWLGQTQWYHFGVGAPPILEPILVGMGAQDFHPWPPHPVNSALRNQTEPRAPPQQRIGPVEGPTRRQRLQRCRRQRVLRLHVPRTRRQGLRLEGPARLRFARRKGNFCGHLFAQNPGQSFPRVLHPHPWCSYLFTLPPINMEPHRPPNMLRLHVDCWKEVFRSPHAKVGKKQKGKREKLKRKKGNAHRCPFRGHRWPYDSKTS